MKAIIIFIFISILVSVNAQIRDVEKLYNRTRHLMDENKMLDALKTNDSIIEFLKNDTSNEYLAKAYLNKHNIYTFSGSVEKALKAGLKSYRLFIVQKNKLGQVKSAINLGIDYGRLQKYDEALVKFNYALKICIDNKYTNDLVNVYNNMGNVYALIGDTNKAIDWYKLSERNIDENSNYVQSFNIKINLLDIFIARNQYDILKKTYFELKKLIKKNNELNNDDCISYVEKSFTKYYLNQKMYDSALILSYSNLKFAFSYKNVETSNEVFKNIYVAYDDLKICDSAYKYYKLYISSNDSILSASKKEQLNEITTNFEFDKNELIFEEKIAHEKDKRNLISIASVAVIILILIFTAIVLKQLFKNKKLVKIVASKNIDLEVKQKEILDSIHYAKRIQNTLLANKEFVNTNIKNNFIYFQPKDIVSGDFYWATHQNNCFYLACCDSTGHGVPGAFMSLLNIGFLSEAIKEKNISQPNEIFNYVRKRLIDSISAEGQKDGFDGILIKIKSSDLQSSTESITIEYASANNEPILISNNQIIELPKDKMPVGQGERKESFALHTLELKKGETLYLYTDGYADQFGGEKGKKFKYKQLNELLLHIHQLPMQEQEQKLSTTFNNWKGSLEQVDDVCVVGIQI